MESLSIINEPNPEPTENIVASELWIQCTLFLSFTSASSKRVEKDESLKTRAILHHFSDLVRRRVDHFFSNGVVPPSIVISGIFLTRDQLIRME